MELQFSTDFATIIEKIDRVNPLLYEKTRNFVDGAVTNLSPYISRGVISTRQGLERLLAKGYKIAEIPASLTE